MRKCGYNTNHNFLQNVDAHTLGATNATCSLSAKKGQPKYQSIVGEQKWMMCTMHFLSDRYNTDTTREAHIQSRGGLGGLKAWTWSFTVIPSDKKLMWNALLGLIETLSFATEHDACTTPGKLFFHLCTVCVCSSIHFSLLFACLLSLLNNILESDMCPTL